MYDVQCTEIYFMFIKNQLENKYFLLKKKKIILRKIINANVFYVIDL